ncbi:hypothetical protein OSTOST_09086 [Ostertagia ostertagi]
MLDQRPSSRSREFTSSSSSIFSNLSLANVMGAKNVEQGSDSTPSLPSSVGTNKICRGICPNGDLEGSTIDLECNFHN